MRLSGDFLIIPLISWSSSFFSRPLGTVPTAPTGKQTNIHSLLYSGTEELPQYYFGNCGSVSKTATSSCTLCCLQYRWKDATICWHLPSRIEKHCLIFLFSVCVRICFNIVYVYKCINSYKFNVAKVWGAIQDFIVFEKYPKILRTFATTLWQQFSLGFQSIRTKNFKLDKHRIFFFFFVIKFQHF